MFTEQGAFWKFLGSFGCIVNWILHWIQWCQTQSFSKTELLSFLTNSWVSHFMFLMLPSSLFVFESGTNYILCVNICALQSFNSCRIFQEYNYYTVLVAIWNLIKNCSPTQKNYIIYINTAHCIWVPSISLCYGCSF